MININRNNIIIVKLTLIIFTTLAVTKNKSICKQQEFCQVKFTIASST